MNRILSLVLVWIGVSLGAEVLASSWIKTGGPIGGLGYNVKIHPNNKKIMFVTDAFSGVQKTTNGGKTWTTANNGIDARSGPTGDEIPVFSLAIDHHNPNLIWAGTQNQRGVFKSIDGGKTFIRKDNGILEDTELTIRNFEIDHDDSDTVLMTGELDVGLSGDEFSRTKGVIYLTNDGGDNWRKLWQGDSLARWSCLELMTVATGIFDREAFNVTGLGVIKSTDGGETWAESNNGVDGSLFVGGMAMDHYDNFMILATGNNNDANKGIQGGIFKSIDAGESWQKLYPIKDGDSTDVFTAATVAPSNPDVIYVGSAEAIYVSKDGGTNWNRLTGKNGAPYGPSGVRSGVPIEIAVDPDKPEIVYVNNYGGGVFKSVNGAKTWKNFSTGYTGANVYSIAISSKNNSHIIVNGRSGPFKSLDGGTKWQGISFTPATFAEGLAVAIDPSNEKIFYISDEHQAIIFKSIDAGKSWIAAFRHPSADASDAENRHGAKELHIAKTNPKMVYAGFAQDKLFSEPRKENFANSFGVYKSVDAGNTWTEKNSGLETSSKNITAMVLSNSDPNLVYIGLREGGIYKTTDGANTWTKISNTDLDATGIYALAINVTDESTEIYAGTSTQGIYKSSDDGSSWTKVLSEETASSPDLSLAESNTKLIRSIQIDSKNPNTIYAADWYSGVYVSRDAGFSWELMNEGLTIRAINDLEISNDGKILYAVSRGEGVFKIFI